MRNLTPETKKKLAESARSFIDSELDVLILSRPMDGNYKIKKNLVVTQDQIHGNLTITITYNPA